MPVFCRGPVAGYRLFRRGGWIAALLRNASMKRRQAHDARLFHPLVASSIAAASQCPGELSAARTTRTQLSWLDGRNSTAVFAPIRYTSPRWFFSSDYGRVVRSGRDSVGGDPASPIVSLDNRFKAPVMTAQSTSRQNVRTTSVSARISARSALWRI